MSQLGIPVDVTAQEVGREATLGGAITLCAKAAGLSPKEVQEALHADRAQFSRWASDQEGITWVKLSGLMDACGNDAPLFWMLHARGYDINSMRKRESEVQAELRITREVLAKERAEREIERRLFKELRMA